MKKIPVHLLTIISVLFLSSCGVGIAITENQYQNSSQVHLAKNNFKVVEKVSGSAEVEYVLLFGGWKKRKLYSDAYRNMVEGANLEGSSKALVNIISEEHIGGFVPFYTKRTLTLSAYVVEFTE